MAGREITVWRSPALLSDLRFDLDSFVLDTEDDRFLESEAWLGEAQTLLRGDQISMEAIGVGIDFNTTFNESFEEGGPYIFLAVGVHHAAGRRLAPVLLGGSDGGRRSVAGSALIVVARRTS